jgi:chromosomal replication initiation ATPase DnaA
VNTTPSTLNTLHSIRRTVNDLSVKIEHLIRCYGNETTEDRGYRPKITAIQKSVADHFDLPIQSMTHKKRPANWAIPRQVAMYLARALTPYSLEEIGKCFGNRDHGTVSYAVTRVQAMREVDAIFATDLIVIRDDAKIALENVELPLFDIKKV